MVLNLEITDLNSSEHELIQPIPIVVSSPEDTGDGFWQATIENIPIFCSGEDQQESIDQLTACVIAQFDRHRLYSTNERKGTVATRHTGLQQYIREIS